MVLNFELSESSFHINVPDCVFVFVFLSFGLGGICRFLYGLLLQCSNEAQFLLMPQKIRSLLNMS